MKTKYFGIIISVLVVIAIGVTIYLSNAVVENTMIRNTYKDVNIMNELINSTTEALGKNYIDENLQGDKVNLIPENMTMGGVINGITSSTTKTTNANTNNNSTNTKTAKERAMELVEKEWGKDNTVYFYVDEEKENNIFVVSVRDKNTTNVLSWYDVNLNTNSVKVQ